MNLNIRFFDIKSKLYFDCDYKANAETENKKGRLEW